MKNDNNTDDKYINKNDNKNGIKKGNNTDNKNPHKNKNSIKNNNEKESDNENDNNLDDNNINDIEINDITWFPDEELQKIYQTLSDINEVGVENNNPKTYLTYPFEVKNDSLKIITKELPEKIKKRLNVYIVKLVKEKEIKRISESNDINIPSLKELEKRIKQVRKELNYIEINDSIFEKIEELHFNEEDADENNMIDYKLYNMAEELNKEFYDDIDAKLQMAQEAINNLKN